MPESYDREGLIDRATDAINDGQPARALEIADEIRRGEGPNADEALIRGIALSSLGRTAEASDAFAEATRRAPESHKARFNAAVHEFNAGNIAGARQLADEAQGLDPTHGGTRALIEKIAAQSAAGPEAPPRLAVNDLTPKPPAPNDPREVPRGGYPGEPLEWIGRMGSGWTAIAFVICAVAFLSFVAVTTIAAREGAFAKTDVSLAQAIQNTQRLQGDPTYLAANLVSQFTGIVAILWTVLDLVRRRANFLWLMAIVPCSCLSFGWLVLPLYLLFGRKS